MALLSVVLLILIVLNLPGSTTARIKLAVGSLFLPLFGLANATHQLANKAEDAVMPRSVLIKQNEALRRENQELQLRLAQATETERENARLRALFEWKQKQRWNLRLATVVLRDPENWWRGVWIDAGSNEDMRTNLTVLTTTGLVGRIDYVGFTRSRVVLLGDPKCKVSATVETGETGIIGEGGPLDGSLLTLSYLPQDARVKPGQSVFTSGQGGVFPRGIPIGKVVDFSQVEYGLAGEARVKPAVDFSSLQEVWVLLP